MPTGNHNHTICNSNLNTFEINTLSNIIISTYLPPVVTMFFARSLFRSSATASSQPGSASTESMHTNGDPKFEVVDDDAGDDPESFRMEPSIENARFRTNFFPSYTMVYGWPSTAGFYTLLCDGVELEFLGLDRLVPTPWSDDSADEDTHCATCAD
ncbi:hypothetical protein CaCOL14_011842 [Colletotrichum acutatum]